jgi:hypothetical protein
MVSLVDGLAGAAAVGSLGAAAASRRCVGGGTRGLGRAGPRLYAGRAGKPAAASFASTEPGRISLQRAIGKTRSASAPICTALEIWSNGSSTRSSSVGEWLHATTSSRTTTSPSFNLRQSGYGCALMSPRPSLKRDGQFAFNRLTSALFGSVGLTGETRFQDPFRRLPWPARRKFPSPAPTSTRC